MTYSLFEFFIIKKIPIKTKGAPSKDPIGICSENKNIHNRDAITGSPNGTDAIAVGVKYLIE
tara:strand:+ start:1006 stop:1191 length:186 start_codon:yes stop_codon:yes gene_type:complete